MTKRLTIAFFLLSLYSTIRAQVRIGIEGGPDYPRLLNIFQGVSGASPTVSNNSQSITRFYCGFLADIPIGKRQLFIFRPSLLYLGAGGQTPQITDNNGNPLELQTNDHFDYAQLPLQFLYSPNLSFGKPWIGGGLYGSLLFNASARTPSGPEYVQIGNSPGDDLERFDLGYSATAGFTFNFGILLGVDFQQTLGTIAPDPRTPQVRNSIWGVKIGYISSIGDGRPKR